MPFLQLGVFNGLNRNLSYYRGAGKADEITTASATGYVYSVFISALSLFVVFLISKTNINDHTSTAFWAFLLLGLMAFAQPLATFFDTLYRTGQDFKKLGKLIIIENSFFAISSILMIIFGYMGFVIQNLLKLLISFCLRFFDNVRKLPVKFSFRSFRDQITTGFPILLNSYLYSTFFVFDQFYIVKSFDKTELGYFNLARLVAYIVPIIPNSLTTIFYPKASLAFGSGDSNRDVLKPFFKKALFTNGMVVIPIVLLVYLLIPLLVENFVPEYSKGIKYAQISVIGGLGYILIGPSVILGVLKKNSVNFLLLLFMSVSTYGLFSIKVLHFSSIIELIWFKNLLFIGYSAIMLVYIYLLLYRRKKFY